MMLGLLLARGGVDVVVMEKHGDFFRDFRGDTVHPSTLELMHELGYLKDFLSRPHQEVQQLRGQIGNESIIFADFSQLKNAACKFIAFMPQWEFLSFLNEKASRYKPFALRMNTEAVDLIEDSGRIVGVVGKQSNGDLLRVKADLVVGADGRSSIVREKAGFEVASEGAPMDVLWMRLSRHGTDPEETLGRIAAGTIFIMLNRNDYWQCGFIIPKGKIDEIRAAGLDKLKERIVAIAPFTADRMDELQSWDEIKLLTVKVDRLKQWYRDGLICIGDAAHAMSPVGGVGINLAVQDAVATANILYAPLKDTRCTTDDLAKVQQRRTYPTRMTQRLQIAIQNAVIKPTLHSDRPITVPLPARLFQIFRPMRAIPANIIGIGFRPEHIHTPECP